jgi:cell cycle sensor histidine kinase DivJ
VLINLLSNAIKFTPRGGTVTVSGECNLTHMTFTVRDTGVGISEDDLRRVGDPFFQVRTAYDRSHDGTGLGLSIVKGLVELHGGDLDIRSRLGQGTSVIVRLPIDCEKAQAVVPASNVERLPVPEPISVPAETRVKKRA